MLFKKFGVGGCVCVGGGGGGWGAELFPCPYPLKVQARPSRVSEQEEKEICI